jgi:multidrug resistance efflux pump
VALAAYCRSDGALVILVLAALVIWDYYVTSPWTRDGSVRVQVAGIAP